MAKQQANLPVEVADARKKEVQEGLSKREFFDKYGFVLLKQASKMSAEDWLGNTYQASSDSFRKLKPGERSPVIDIYAKELEPLIRELLPNTAQIRFPDFALRRGPGGPNPHYGFGVHQDYGLYPEDMETTYRTGLEGSFEDFLTRMYHEETAGFSVINFWRPVPPMAGPVRSTPLALCDPNTATGLLLRNVFQFFKLRGIEIIINRKINMYMYMYMYIYIYMFVLVYAYIYIYIHIHIQYRIYIYT